MKNPRTTVHYFYDNIVKPINCLDGVVDKKIEWDPIVSTDEYHGNINGTIDFVDGSKVEFYESLHIREKEKQIEKISFKYNYLSAERQLLLGWHGDHKEKKYKYLNSFPRHKHLPDDKIGECPEPEMNKFLSEVHECRIQRRAIFI